VVEVAQFQYSEGIAQSFVSVRSVTPRVTITTDSPSASVVIHVAGSWTTSWCGTPCSC